MYMCTQFIISEATLADLYTQCFNVIGSVCSPGKVWQIELDLVPAVVQPHGHGADERLHPRRALIVTRSKTSPDIFVIQDLRCKDVRSSKMLLLCQCQ